jgi:hypothetical protein
MQRRRMERIDIGGGAGAGAEADMAAAFRRDLRHGRAQIDPELGIGFAETDGRRARHQPRKAERRQACFIEARGSLEVADADGDVVDHGSPRSQPSLRGALATKQSILSFR